MKIYNLILSLFFLVFLTACSSTTNAGLTNENSSQLMLISSAEMNNMANNEYDKIIYLANKKGTLNKDKKLYNRVKKITNRLVSNVGYFREDARNWEWEINLIDEDILNAWCMPGGKMVIYSGIIKKLNLNDAQIAAIMGHEMAHALREHAREQASTNMAKNLGIQTLSAYFQLDDTSKKLANVAGKYLITLPFSRSHETQADRIGTELMALSGYNPYEAINLWKKMDKISRNNNIEFLSTHPSHENRIKDLENIASKVEIHYKNYAK